MYVSSILSYPESAIEIYIIQRKRFRNIIMI